MREIFDIPESVETRLWNKYTSNTYEQLGKMDISVQVTNFFQNLNSSLHESS